MDARNNNPQLLEAYSFVDCEDLSNVSYTFRGIDKDTVEATFNEGQVLDLVTIEQSLNL